MLMVLRAAALLGSVALALAPPPGATATAAAGVEVPIDQYPMAPPQPAGDSRPPLFLDDDETVRGRLAPDGSISSMTDDVILRLRGSGDYVIVMPGHATDVRNNGTDAPPSLQDGHVTFMSSIFGQGQLGAEATLDRAAARSVPLTVRISYQAGGRAIRGADMGAQHGAVSVRIEMVNLTAVPHEYVVGNPSAASLAPILEDLRQVPPIYTPETDLQGLFPLPRALSIPAPVTRQVQDTFVPLSLTVTVKLAAGASILDSGGADVTPDPRGSRLSWIHRLPAAPGGQGREVLTFQYSAPNQRLPSIEVKADPLPLPASLFTPPGGGSWAAFLTRAPDRSAAALLAQQGTASLHRIQDLVPPLNRPGPGPQKVKYDLILDSGTAAVRPSAPPSPAHAQPWAVAVVLLIGLFAALNAGWAWSRH